jgi:hypothetical protein
MIDVESLSILKTELHSYGDSFVHCLEGIKVFETGSCEFCGDLVQEVNATKVTNVPPVLAIELGLKELETEPSEIWYSDEAGCTVCDNCDPEVDDG